MKKSKLKIRTVVLGILLVLMAMTTVYNFFDNSRIKVVEQQIVIGRLPESFDGFRILQISDLHGKYFGKKQVDLLKIINNLDYDMIAFTGDMNKSAEKSIESSSAIFDLIDGIKKKDSVFWVDGNTGPYAISGIDSVKTDELTEVGEILKEKGCNILTLPYGISRGNDRIWIAPEMLEISFLAANSIDAEKAGGEENLKKVQAFTQKAKTVFNAINRNDEVKILLDHYPKQTNLTEEEWNQMGWLDYDLIIAGHYHGGQFRIPFIGALYIPSPTSGIFSGYFPKQNAVKGLNSVSGIPQYISAGLGTSTSIEILNFRLFNTPEINVITLKCE